MFGWSMFFGVLGVLSLLAAGYSFSANRATPQKGEQPKKNKFPYRETAAVTGVAGLALFIASYFCFYWHFAGKITTPDWLNPKSIYRVGGQANIEEQNVVFLGSAGKDVWAIGSEPIDSRVRFVRSVKSPDGKWRLEALDMSPKTAEK